ncbi:MAG: hypothetical protein BGO01_17800 [Armatimonadetes bacterium 55-13]|nr:carbohydrate ABC transporter permease [Armatimonadota bacterium]ODU52985.1 MAG: hypothetical protein ABT09_02230 [bacterium SCN 57-13]OJU63995.1 MAG: hypothetical protein BGO01_17800 [Armatimonadetes bacterium 55-13]
MIYAIGTLLTWLGWFAAFRTVQLGLQMALGSNGPSDGKLTRNLGISAVVAAVGLAIGATLPSLLEKRPAGVVIPLVWFVMPYSAWLGVLCLVYGLVRLVQGFFAINEEERTDRLKAAGIWGIGLAIFGTLYKMDPDSKIEILKGGIPFSINAAASIILGLVAAMAIMIWAGRTAKNRGLSKTIVTQIALIAGSIVFGLPFAYLVITSFKEDRDMSSPNGIVWVPRVQETHPYMDPKNPLFELQENGQTVRGVVTQREANDVVKVDVQSPMAIRGTTIETQFSKLKEVPRDAPIYTAKLDGTDVTGFAIEALEDGGVKLQLTAPANLKGKEVQFGPEDIEPVRHIGLRTENYTEALSYLPPETNNGLVYVKNTLILVVLSVVGTILSSSIVAYAFSRMKFPGRDLLFAILLSTMMLPGAVTLLPQFLIFRRLGWIDTLYPIWVPAFFASAFNVFLLRQFFKGIPMELEDAAKIDGCSYFRAFWSIMLPQIKPALAVIAIWTFMAAWNNFMQPLIYINSPENMPLSYALQLFQGDRSGEPGLLMAFATLTILPVLGVFFFAQKYFIEGVTLSGLGGR